MATYTTKINRFDEGIVNDPRGSSGCRVVTNFDTTDPYKLTPYRSSESGDSGAATSQKRNFCIALGNDDYYLFGLGVQSGASDAEVLRKALETSSNDLSDDGWLSYGAAAKYQSSGGAVGFDLFTYYKKAGLIYCADNTNDHIMAFDPAGSANWDDDVLGASPITWTTMAEGLVHSKDDILYIPYDNKILKYNGTDWTAAALTLPTHLYITSICERGNYLAIACAPLSGIGKSVVYLWDRDASLATLSESIDWGEGILKVIEEVDGILVGISSIGGYTYHLDDRVVFRYSSGSKAIIFDELVGDLGVVVNTFPNTKQLYNSRLYFMLAITINGAIREGVWSIGRIADGFKIVHERTPNNDTALSGGKLFNLFWAGDFLFISYLTSSAYALSKTIYTPATYTAKSIYETLIDNGRHKGFDSSVTKKLKGVICIFQPLSSATAQVVLQYQKDEDIGGATWTTIFTKTGANAISHSAINISGVTLPRYKEIQYRIESTKNAVLTGFKSKWEVIDKDIYST